MRKLSISQQMEYGYIQIVVTVTCNGRNRTYYPGPDGVAAVERFVNARRTVVEVTPEDGVSVTVLVPDKRQRISPFAHLLAA